MTELAIMSLQMTLTKLNFFLKSKLWIDFVTVATFIILSWENIFGVYLEN